MNQRDTRTDFAAAGRRAVRTEREAIAALEKRIGPAFVAACEMLLACSGRIAVLGMGKSGHIARKISATLASTGSPSLFVHPAEASHGDMGMITSDDTVLALSNSGRTPEILALIPALKRLRVGLIAMTGSEDSPLAQSADIHLNTGVSAEACPLDLAPTASTTAALVMGDALAIALLEARGFSEEDFARFHPGGTLGRRLLLRVADLMHRGERIPRVTLDTLLAETLVEMSSKGLGMTTVVDSEGIMQGVFTDGDLRRALDRGVDLHSTAAEAVMTRGGRTVAANLLAAEALNLMEQHRIAALVCVDQAGRPEGIVHMQELLQAGVA